MAKRGYKLQEFVAHSGNVNCLRIGKKNFRQFITGGDDQTVNLWSIGKPEPLTSLSGHTCPVESVAFDSKEVLVVAGASSGVIKLWDLEETKMVRTLTRHRSYCTAVEFHPFGEFFASGSMDTNVKIWDIRKKGCIHTYKGHTRGISTIRFTPDGRWVISGGFDNVVKIWDLTAGKLLHDFKLHEGHIRSIDFHPLEFLLATGSADKTVKFWDLETFEMIGSARRETAGVRSITFHPDGRALFCGLDDSLKVYSWEPVICHDSVDMGWSTLGDLCVHDGKLLGGAYYQNSVGVWVADISLIEPYGAGVVPEQNSHQKHELQQHASEKSISYGRSSSSVRSMSPDIDSKDIKNIYIDTAGCTSVNSTEVGSRNSPKAEIPSESNEITSLASQKQVSAVGRHAKTNVSANTKSFIVPSIIPREGPEVKDLAGSRRESFASARATTGTFKPSHIRRPSNTKFDMEKMSTALESGSFGTMTSPVDPKHNPNFNSRLVCNNIAKESSVEKDLSINNVREKSEKASLLTRPSDQENGQRPQDCDKGVIPVKVVNGVAVVRGRTRSLVERFEKRDGLKSIEAQTPDKAPHPITEAADTSLLCNNQQSAGREVIQCNNQPSAGREVMQRNNQPSAGQEVIPCNNQQSSGREVMQCNNLQSAGREVIQCNNQPSAGREVMQCNNQPSAGQEVIPRNNQQSSGREVMQCNNLQSAGREVMQCNNQQSAGRAVTQCNNQQSAGREVMQCNNQQSAGSEVMQCNDQQSAGREASQCNNQQNAGREESVTDDNHVIEVLMQNHDVLLSTFRSRLTKLQVVRHFWERKDAKGAINAMRKLPDHSVQADVVSVLTEKMEIITLDLFSCLLPVLLGLLDSKVERHASVSLEMLLKLIAVFGPLVHSTVSAPRAVGVDLQAEERLQSCKQCSVHLQNVQKMIPTLIQRGGSVARCAQELRLVLQEP